MMLGLHMIINAVRELSMTRDLPHILVLLLFWFMFVISRAVTYFRINLAFLTNDRGMLPVDCLYNYYYEYFLYFIVTQILLNQHVNCLKSYFYFFLYCIATQIPPHLYNLRIGVGWTNFGVCW